MAALGHVRLARRIDAEFDRARRRNLWRRMLDRLRDEPGRLAAFEDAGTGWSNRASLGLRAVAVEKIVGSVGRAEDFDRAFMPVKPALRERWNLVNLAYHRDEPLPPVRLNKIGDRYFVVDGNHRVSVARFHGVGWVDAEVTEFRPPDGAEDWRSQKEWVTRFYAKGAGS